MKGITDYFGGSAKTDSPNLQDIEDKRSDESNEHDSKVQKIDNANDVQKSKKRRKKAKRKPSDPAVKNIADLLSSSLAIVSPNSTIPKPIIGQAIEEDEVRGSVSSDEILIVEHQKNEKNNSCNLPTDEISQSDRIIKLKEQNEQLTIKTKMNAFQFMMEGRKKSIGQNSPGKELCYDKLDNKIELKEVLSIRKSLLQNWSEKKGATKRKREEEEIEETINYKLQKRAKHLKKLLKADELNDSITDVAKKTRKKIKTISSSSEESNKDCILLDSLSNTTITKSEIEIIEENAQESVFNQSKTKETKQGLLTFFGVFHKTKESQTIDKKITNDTDKESVTETLETSKSKKKRLKSNKITTEPSKIIIKENSEGSTQMKKFKSKKEKKYVDEESDECVRMEKTPKTNKKTKENEDNNFTPRSAKSWKMKIKMSENKQEEQDKIEVKTEEKRPLRVKRIPNYSLVFSDESSNDDDTVPQRKTKSKDLEIVDVVCLDTSSDKEKRDSCKPIKVAPVFAKSTPKPKIAPEVIEARKQFLMSGIPDSLKKSLERQQIADEREYDIFPSISHIQQRCETQTFWNLLKPQLDLKLYSPLKVDTPMICANVTNSHIANRIDIQKEVEKVDKLKTLLNRIKLDNPNYPVYKSFRLIYEKSGKALEKKVECKTNKKRHPKSADRTIEIVENTKSETDLIEHSMWTDKYKPKCSEDIIGNGEGVKSLKKWLEYWKNFSDEINAKKKKRSEYSSESDFDTTDCDSRDSTKLPGNTIVIGGPCGSGKSTAVYAICTEFGFNVIELNASSKRTGKRLLQELQEATQSHQVRKKEQNMQNYLHPTKKAETKGPRKKMCVLLIEDVDIVFEQDDGFISALNQLVSTSKRPIIFTTTDTSSIFVQKFISLYEYISFLPLSSQSLATWLQIVCLVEGLFVNQGDIGSLLEFNKGDVRKTLLQLQFWVQSGGQIVRDNLPLKMKTTASTMEKKLLDDEQEPCLNGGSEVPETFVHSDCFKSFQIFRHHKSYRIPYYLNLGLLWWNIPNILGIQGFSDDRIKKFKDVKCEIKDKMSRNEVSPQNKQLSTIEQRKLHVLSKLYDSLVFTDVSFRNLDYFDGLEPVVKNYSSDIRDSLELGETMDSYNGLKDFMHELTHDLVNGHLEEFSSIEKNDSVLNIAVPEKAERRWRAKLHVCEDVFREALPLSTFVERRSVALDYMPFLRDMSRSECRRATSNTKRGNRFRNYLRGLGISYNDNSLKLACNILRENYF